MIFKNIFIFAVLAYIGAAEARFVSWSGTTPGVYEDGGHKLVAKLPCAAKLSQRGVFAWLKLQGVDTSDYPQAFDTWVRGAYKHALGYAWRWEWPYLFCAAKMHSSWPCFSKDKKDTFVFFMNSTTERYVSLSTIDAENLTADQLREKLHGIPDEVTEQILSEFVSQNRHVLFDMHPFDDPVYQQFLVDIDAGRVDLLEETLAKYPKLKQQDTIDHALDYAARVGQCAAVSFLLSRGAKASAAVAYNAVTYRHPDVMQILLANGACLTDGFSLASGWVSIVDLQLIVAAQGGNLKDVFKALENGANICAEGSYALSQAAVYECADPATEARHCAIVELLLDRGANIHADDDRALRAAARYGHAAIVQLLLARGAKADACGSEALQSAASYGHAGIVGNLLDYGADVNAIGRYSRRAIDWAQENGHADVVELLLARGSKEPFPTRQQLLEEYENRLRKSCCSEKRDDI